MNSVCLIVDDHRGLRDLLKQWLANNFPQITFHAVASAEEAVEMVKKIKPHTVIMDIGLPNMNGIEATKQLKQMHPDIKVIIHTIHEEPIYMEKAASIGADFYVSKKRTQTALLPAIRTAFSLAD